MKIDVKTLDAEDAGSVELADHIFGLEPRADILHRMVNWQLAKRRAGTHKAKDRGEVAYSTAKIYKQKGTGRARHGSKKVGVFRGGGKAFGPVSRDHAHDLPKKVRALALKYALSSKARAEEVIVIDQAVSGEAKTKSILASFEKLGLKHALIIGGTEIDVNFGLAARNVHGIDVLPVQGINVYDVLRCKQLVLTKAAIEALEERFK
ncbi:large subunit ribosomal protein L4 [Rhodoligotrophos appendicifer]|uniref:50S ribosomal protein L4 n=1 Tax=Rhodoligotrophos appendicifer TaxID=987056 RepID=UPI0011861998|nr:50S ribosomal protein L4 [Rhodoligotrophos appendicifer]